MKEKWNRCATSYTRWTIRLSLMDVPLICINLLGQDVTPHQIINPIIDVNTYFRNHHTPGALLYEFAIQGAMKPQIPGATRWNSQLESNTIFNPEYTILFNDQSST